MTTSVQDYADSFPRKTKRNVVCRIYPNRTKKYPFDAKKIGGITRNAIEHGEYDVLILRAVLANMPGLQSKLCLALDALRYIDITLNILLPALTVLRAVLLVVRFATPLTFIELSAVVIAIEKLKLGLEENGLAVKVASELKSYICED